MNIEYVRINTIIFLISILFLMSCTNHRVVKYQEIGYIEPLKENRYYYSREHIAKYCFDDSSRSDRKNKYYLDFIFISNKDSFKDIKNKYEFEDVIIKYDELTVCLNIVCEKFKECLLVYKVE